MGKVTIAILTGELAVQTIRGGWTHFLQRHHVRVHAADHRGRLVEIARPNENVVRADLDCRRAFGASGARNDRFAWNCRAGRESYAGEEIQRPREHDTSGEIERNSAGFRVTDIIAAAHAPYSDPSRRGVAIGMVLSQALPLGNEPKEG